ncbi:MAG TPA: extracellular solute-binding protein [Puia sp.]|jgi:multiple sugar transport system substrate-binding protein|nr:extracellular solute-binding protein [Puia sp.]
MFSSFRIWLVLIILNLLCSCSVHKRKDEQLLFWCSNNPREIDLCNSFTDEWNHAHPENRIHLQPIPEGQSSEEVILAAVVGKTTPDIYANMWQGNVEMFARAGVLIPLDTLRGFLQFIHERCDTSVIKEITSVDGHIYQVPWKVNPFMTIYNKTLFIKNGIHELPYTYSAYRKAASIFKVNSHLKGSTQKWFGYTEVKEIWLQRLFNFYPLYLAASGGAPLIIKNKAAFNNKYAIEVFAFLQSLYNDEYFSRENLSASEDPFVAQQIATKWTGPWEIAYLNTIPDRNFEFGYFEPQVPDDHQGPVYTYADPKNIVVFNTCTKPQAAWDLIRTMIDKKGDLKLLTNTGQFPRRKNLQSDNFYNEYFRLNPMMIPFAKELPYVKGVDNCEVIVEVLDIISQEYESCVVYGKKTPEKAIKDAETAVNVLLAGASKM